MTGQNKFPFDANSFEGTVKEVSASPEINFAEAF
jgi:hypothetical protein